MEQRIVPRDKLLRDALDPHQKQRRAKKRLEAREREYRQYAGERKAKHLREKARG